MILQVISHIKKIFLSAPKTSTYTLKKFHKLRSIFSALCASTLKAFSAQIKQTHLSKYLLKQQSYDSIKMSLILNVLKSNKKSNFQAFSTGRKQVRQQVDFFLKIRRMKLKIYGLISSKCEGLVIKKTLQDEIDFASSAIH